MSAEEAANNTTATAAPSTADGGKKKKNERKRDETPIEELFDLSQPIPKVERPNKDEHDKIVQALTDELEALKEERRKVQEDIDAAMADPDGKSVVSVARNKLGTLKAQKNALIEEKKSMRAALDTAKTQTDKLVKDKKDVKANTRYSSIEEIDAAVAKLKRQQETTTMSLNEEKRLIKEMDALQASKKYIAELKSKDAAMEGMKEQKKNLSQQIAAKDKEIDAISKEMDAIKVEIDAFNEKDTKKRDAIQGLLKKREELKKTIGIKLKEKDTIRDDFREKNNAWFTYQRAVRAQKKMQYEEEKKKREEEKAAYLAKLEAEEAKKIPYEEEQALCDYLADYLERTYLKPGNGTTEEKKDESAATVADDAFAGFKPVNKKADEEYFGKGKGKKKRERKSKKEAAAGPFTLSVDTFDQFGLVNLTPPTSIEQVEASVKALREKKEWYKQQPRGSVPTAAEIRKANEKEAARLRQSSNGDEAPKAKPKKGQFSLSNDEFAPLGAGGAASSLNSSWGQKPVVESTVAEEGS